MLASSSFFPTHHDQMMAAFGIVEPSSDWRHPILSVFSHSALTNAGVTLADVIEAVGYFTATVPTVIEDEWDGSITVSAIGYRDGPAGS
ncbi:hypothetical protein [uncultured Mediterranean phage uvMED]|nr:hypothetical protein [uncultured Mediterranean phage uvMED]